MRLNDVARLGVQLGVNGYGPFGRRPEEDLPGVLAILAGLGFDGAEIHLNTWYRGPLVVRDAFAGAGLDLAAVHMFEAEAGPPGRWAALLDDLVSAGCPRVILSAHGKHSEEDFLLLAGRLQGAAAQARDRGISTYYHPHDADFAPLGRECGLRGIDVVCANTDRDLLRINLDVYWAYAGGADPVTAIRQFADRADYYHIKDGDKKRSSPLGLGDVPLAESMRLLGSPGIPAEWIVYEDPKPQLPPIASCRLAKEYMREHGFAGRRDVKAVIRQGIISY